MIIQIIIFRETTTKTPRYVTALPPGPRRASALLLPLSPPSLKKQHTLVRAAPSVTHTTDTDTHTELLLQTPDR